MYDLKNIVHEIKYILDIAEVKKNEIEHITKDAKQIKEDWKKIWKKISDL